MTDQPKKTTAVAAYRPPVDNSSLALAPEAWKLASRIASTAIVPKSIQGSPESVLAIILAGHEAGVSPMQALNKIHIVEGRVAMSAELMRALVLRAGHELWIEEATTTRVIVKGSRAGSERVSTVTWTMDDAKRANLSGKNNWRSYPRAMLLARATTEICRLLFADVLAGITHSVEELSDGEAMDDSVLDLGPAEVVHDSSPQDPVSASTPTTARKSSHKATGKQGAADPDDIPAPPPAQKGEVPDLPGEDDDIIEAEVIEAEVIEPEEDEFGLTEPDADGPADLPPLPESEEAWPDDDDPPNEADAGPRLSGPQMIAIKLGDRGVKERGAKLRAVEQILDVEAGSVATSKDLTPEQVSKVLAYLDELPEGQNLIVDVEPPPAKPEPTPKRAAVTPVEEWTGDKWREFLKQRKVKVAPTMKEAQRLAHKISAERTIATLDDLAGSGVEAELVGWIEEQ